MAKKERIERLIASMDNILKGDNRGNFTVFTKTEIEKMFQLMFTACRRKCVKRPCRIWRRRAVAESIIWKSYRQKTFKKAMQK